MLSEVSSSILIYFNPRTREECDSPGKDKIYLPSKISIHALARSATTVRNALFTGLQNFNPRTREECDLKKQNQR